MKLHVFCVRDRAIDSFGSPMFLASEGQAIRSFSDEVNRVAADNLMNKHPEDYDLYRLGSWESDTGMFDVGVPKQIAVGKSLIIQN